MQGRKKGKEKFEGQRREKEDPNLFSFRERNSSILQERGNRRHNLGKRKKFCSGERGDKEIASPIWAGGKRKVKPSRKGVKIGSHMR